MSLAELLYAYRRPYSWMLHEAFLEGILLQTRVLDFDMELQTQTNWCWAATATSVSHYFWSWSTWTQCRVANGELGRSDCCSATVPGACNVPWFLDRALDRTDNFVSMSGVASFETVRAEIDAGRPVGARVGWSGGGGHFMVIYGYSVHGGDQYFDIDDPIYGKSRLTVSDFTSNYQGSGSWTHTYITKPYFPMLVIRPILVNDDILQRIWATRPLLNPAGTAGGGARQGNEPPEDWKRGSLALAHRVYALGLDALMEKRKGIKAAEPVALRVLESRDHRIEALFDVTGEDDPRVQQMSSARVYLDKLGRALAGAESVAREEGGPAKPQAKGKKGPSKKEAAKSATDESSGAREVELRMLRIPAANFEALWLHSDDEAPDRLVPIISLGALVPFEPVPMDEALDVLRKEASALVEMDDTMGA